MSTVKDEPKKDDGAIDEGDVKPADQKPPEQPEELGVPAMEFIARSLNQTARPKKEKKAPPPPTDEDEDGDAEPKPAKKPAARKPAPAAQPLREIDEDRLGEAVGRAVAAATKPKEVEKPAADAGLSDMDKLRVTRLRHMETLFGDKYKDKKPADAYVAKLKAVDEYSAQWEKDHPGEKFNPKDDEHAEFYERHEAELDELYDGDDYVEAMTDLNVADRIKKVDETVARRLESIERQEKLKEHHPKIIETRDKVGNRFWERMGDEFKDVLDLTGGLAPEQVAAKLKRGEPITPILNRDALTALKESDPDTHNAVVQAAEASEIYATETYLLDNNLVEYDPQKPTHQFLSKFATDAEQRMVARSPEKQLDGEGRTFLPRAEFNKLSKAKRAEHWTFSYEDLGFLIAAHIAKQTQGYLKAEEDKFARRATGRGLIEKGASLPAKSRRLPDTDEDDEDLSNGKPDSPSTPIGTRMAPSRIKVDTSQGSGLEGFVSRALGKR